MKKWVKLLCFMLFASLFVPHGQADASTVFRDVGTSHRAQAEIYYLVQGEITSGTSSTTFSPDKQVTRQEAAVMIGRALGLNGDKRSTKFKDVSSGSFASGYIQEMVNRKVINGYPDGTFKPTKTLSRGEMAMLIDRAFEYGAGSVGAATSNLKNRGIAQGLADGSFGENQTIKRADFAVFLARAVNEKFRTKAASFGKTMYVNTNDLNVRTGPNTNYPSIGKFNKNTTVQFAYGVNDWYYVKSGSTKGFVHSAYLQANKPGTASPAAPSPSKGDLSVILDPGHGGSDPGASGFGFLEKNVVLNISNHAKKYFAKTPIELKMTRTGDTYPTLGQRAAYASKYGGDIFVSVHANAFNGSANGQETYYYASTAATNPKVKESRALAIYLQARMQEAWNLGDRGAKHGNYAVLRENTVPAALVEVGFIDSSKDIQYIKSDTEREKMGRAIFLGTLDYFYHYEGRQDVKSLYNVANGSPSKRLH